MGYKDRFSGGFARASGISRSMSRRLFSTKVGLRKGSIGTLLLVLVLALLTPYCFPPGIGPAHAAANWVVTSLTDVAGACPGSLCTLRTAINDANRDSGDSITFAVSGTIALNLGLPTITTVMTIDGAGKTVTISGNKISYIFDVDGSASSSSVALTLNNLSVVNGFDSGTDGAGLYSASATVTIQNCTFSGNSASNGGAIFNGGTMIIQNSVISGNSATFVFGGFGGGVENQGTLTVINSSIS